MYRLKTYLQQDSVACFNYSKLYLATIPEDIYLLRGCSIRLRRLNLSYYSCKFLEKSL